MLEALEVHMRPARALVHVDVVATSTVVHVIRDTIVYGDDITDRTLKVHASNQL